MGKISDWANPKIKKMNWIDIQFVKLASMAFILMIARLWPPIATLDWYWYGILMLLAAAVPMKKIFS